VRVAGNLTLSRAVLGVSWAVMVVVLPVLSTTTTPPPLGDGGIRAGRHLPSTRPLVPLSEVGNRKVCAGNCEMKSEFVHDASSPSVLCRPAR